MTSVLNNDGPTTYPSNTTALAIDQAAPPADNIATVPAPYSVAPTVSGGSAVDRAQATIEAVENQFGKYLATIRAEHYSPEGLRAQIRAFADTHAGRAIDSALDAARQRRDDAHTAVDHARRELSPDGDTAAELRASRYWNRTQRLLDSLSPTKASDAATTLIKDANAAELATLLQELLPYLQSRGIEAATYIDAALRDRAPEYTNAKKRATAADKALIVMEYNAKTLRERINGLTAPGGYRRPILVDARPYDPDR
ncbi:hypothetical protein [Nocardia sp. R7R-8]|uniref:hypothetical protein n=1 Tax=Nocardia sp. R7R-8 TaxID=3459304 RepID=UPI00403E1FD7